MNAQTENTEFQAIIANQYREDGREALATARKALERALREIDKYTEWYEQAESAQFGGLLGAGHVDVLADMARHGELAVEHRQLTGNVEHVAADDEGHVVGRRCCRYGNVVAQFLDAFFDFSGHDGLRFWSPTSYIGSARLSREGHCGEGRNVGNE